MFVQKTCTRVLNPLFGKKWSKNLNKIIINNYLINFAQLFCNEVRKVGLLHFFLLRCKKVDRKLNPFLNLNLNLNLKLVNIKNVLEF